jgi:hypothetical protein
MTTFYAPGVSTDFTGGSESHLRKLRYLYTSPVGMTRILGCEEVANGWNIELKTHPGIRHN